MLLKTRTCFAISAGLRPNRSAAMTEPDGRKTRDVDIIKLPVAGTLRVPSAPILRLPRKHPIGGWGRAPPKMDGRTAPNSWESAQARKGRCLLEAMSRSGRKAHYGSHYRDGHPPRFARWWTAGRGDFAQAGSRGGEEPAKQSAFSFSFSSRAFQLSALLLFRRRMRRLGRDHGFAIAKEPAGVIDQKQVASEGKPLEHPFT